METDILHTTFLYSAQNDIFTLSTTCICAGPVVESGFFWIFFACGHILSMDNGVSVYKAWLGGSGEECLGGWWCGLWKLLLSP